MIIIIIIDESVTLLLLIPVTLHFRLFVQCVTQKYIENAKFLLADLYIARDNLFLYQKKV